MERTQIINELKKVRYPGFSRDIISFGLISNIIVNNDKVTIVMKYTTQPTDVQDQIEKSIIEQLKNTGKVREVEIKKEFLQQQPAGATGKRKTSAKYVVAIASGKGGVGKSSVTAILAIVLSKLNYKVGIIDADVYGPSIPLILGIQDVPTVSDDNKITIPIKNNIKVISIGLLVPDTEAVIWRGPMIYKAFDQFLFDADWGTLDFLLIDLPPGTGDAPLSLVQLSDVAGVVIVSTPQRASANVAKKSIFMFNKLQVRILGIIENMSYFACNKCSEQHYIFGTGVVENMARNLNVPFLCKIPIDNNVIKLADNGNLFVIEKESPQTYDQYLKIAQSIIKKCL